MDRMTGHGAGRCKQAVLWQIDKVIWELCRGVRGFSRSFGRWGWGLIASVLVFAAAAYVAFQQKAELHELKTQFAERTVVKPDTPRAPGTVAPETDMDRLAAFEGYLLPNADIPVLVQDLLRLAEAQGLSLQRGEYRPQVDSVGGFLRYRMNLPVKGPAPAIHRFMREALRNQRSLALERVQFKRERVESAEVQANIQWVVLSRLPVQGLTSLAIPTLGSDVGVAASPNVGTTGIR